MEKKLIEAGFLKKDANFYHRGDAALYRDHRNGRWYLRQGVSVPREMGRTLGEAIGKVLEVVK